MFSKNQTIRSRSVKTIKMPFDDHFDCHSNDSNDSYNYKDKPIIKKKKKKDTKYVHIYNPQDFKEYDVNKVNYVSM